MAKSRQLGLRLDESDQADLKRLAAREGRTEQDIMRDSLRMYVRTADDHKAFLDSVERGWYEVRSGLGEIVTDDDDFFESLYRDLRNEDNSGIEAKTLCSSITKVGQKAVTPALCASVRTSGTTSLVRN